MRNLKFISALMLISVLFLAGCDSKKTSNISTPETITVKTQLVSGIASEKKLSVSGNIEGNKTVRTGFMVAGKIVKITAEEGQTVRSGQLLASLDDESYQIAKDMADANLFQTQDEYKRLSEMYKRGSISESDFTKISTALKVAQSQQRLQAKNLKETKLYVPFDGVLLKRLAETGEIIDAGMPLFVVSDIHTVKVNASVPESELHFIKTGSEAEVYVSALDSVYSGKITETGSAAEPATRTFTVKIELKNPKLLLKPGMTAEVQIITDKEENYITVPAECLLHDIDNSSYLFVADTAKNIALKRKVSLGSIFGNNVEVVSGLSEGEQIIVSGQNKLTNGTSISIK